MALLWEHGNKLVEHFNRVAPGIHFANLSNYPGDGYHVVADRYVSANQIHQGGKIDNPRERQKFMDWLHLMEHKVFGIPTPHLVIISMCHSK